MQLIIVDHMFLPYVTILILNQRQSVSKVTHCTMCCLCIRCDILSLLTSYAHILYSIGRMCLVDVKGEKKPLPACRTKVNEGQDIHTNTDELKAFRRR